MVLFMLAPYNHPIL